MWTVFVGFILLQAVTQSREENVVGKLIEDGAALQEDWQTRLGDLVDLREPATISMAARNSLADDGSCGKAKVSAPTTTPVERQDAYAGEWPWQAMILRFSDVNAQFGVRCGGTLIAKQWVLSAAQCFDIYATSHNMIVLGAHYQNLTLRNFKAVASGAIICHPEYNKTTHDNDICLVKLAFEVTYTNYFLPVCLPASTDEVISGESCTITGWGGTRGTLRGAQVKIFANAECTRRWQAHSRTVPPRTVCGGYADGSGVSCDKDIGGPLVCKRNDGGTAHFKLFGVSSFAVQNCTQMLRIPSVYTDVTKYLNWINNVQKNSPDVSMCFDKSTIRTCGATISLNNSIIRSPVLNYNTWMYPNGMDCTWTIQAPIGYVLRFEFLCFMSLEDIGTASSSCLKDYLRIKRTDGRTMTYCGSHYVDKLDAYEIGGNLANVTFHSDSSLSAQGFVARVVFVKKYNNEPMCFDKTTIRKCGTTVTTDNTIIRSPVASYETWMYPTSLDCSWNIRAPAGHTLRFDFLCFMSIEALRSSGALCTDDYLKIETPDGSSKPYCGSHSVENLEAYETRGNQATLIFHSDSISPAQGFVVRVIFVRQFEPVAVTVSSSSLKISESVKAINCTATGHPIPSVIWTKDNLTVSTTASDNIYQNVMSGAATLYIRNPKVIHEGEYKCSAKNTNGVKDFKDFKSINITIANQPTIVSIEAYPCNSSLKVQWRPHALATGTQHRLTISRQETVVFKAMITPIDTSMQAIIAENLTSSTAYYVTITPCQTWTCKSLYMATEQSFTGGKPQPVNSARLEKQDGICKVYWTLPAMTPHSVITGFKITTQLKVARVPAGSKGSSKEEIHQVSSTSISYSIPKRPNRNHTVTIEPLSCAGPGRKVVAKGDCVTEPTVPTSLATLRRSSDLKDGKIFISLHAPDETNGLVSCVFIAVHVGGSAKHEDIYKILNGTLSQESRVTYISMATAPSRGIATLNVVIGDDTTSSCNIRQVAARRKRELTTNDVIIGRNFPLSDSKINSIYMVTATPSKNEVLYQISEALIVGQQSADTTVFYVAPIVAVLVVFGVVCVIIVAVKKKKNRRVKREKQQKEIDRKVSVFGIPTRAPPQPPLPLPPPRLQCDMEKEPRYMTVTPRLQCDMEEEPGYVTIESCSLHTTKEFGSTAPSRDEAENKARYTNAPKTVGEQSKATEDVEENPHLKPIVTPKAAEIQRSTTPSRNEVENEARYTMGPKTAGGQSKVTEEVEENPNDKPIVPPSAAEGQTDASDKVKENPDGKSIIHFKTTKENVEVSKNAFSGTGRARASL